MQLFRTLLNIACELLNRIVAVGGLLRLIALMPGDNVPVDKIEGGDDDGVFHDDYPLRVCLG